MESKKGIVSLIFLIAGGILTFYDLLIGIIITVMAFICSLAYFKNKSVLSLIVMIISIILLCIQTVIFIVAYKVVKKSYDNVNLTTMHLYEERIVLKTKEEIAIREVYGKIPADQETIVLDASELVDIKNGCIGYSIYDIKTKDVKAYIKCDNYTTKGFDSKYLDK